MTDSYFDPEKKPELEDLEFLEHFGVLGMHWGIRKDRSGSGRESGKKEPPAGGKPSSINPPKGPGGRKETEAESQSRQMEAKYGKDSMKESKPGPIEKHPGWNGLTPAQKKAAIALGGLALVGGAIALNHYLDKGVTAKKLAAEAADLRQVMEQLTAASKADVATVGGIGLGHHWEKGIELEAGAILQRMSTVKESTIHPKGFYAAFDQADVERYKAELPNWWKRWGYKETSGYLTQIKAGTKVKAPSGKESLEMFKHIIDDDEVLRTMGHEGRAILKMSPENRAVAVDGLAKLRFPNFTANWIAGQQHDPHVTKYFEEATRRGYNALIDFNDSGQLAKTPLRVIDASPFSIVGNKKVSERAIAVAQNNLTPLVMHGIGGNEMQTLTEDLEFLSHYGVQGMRWGVRKKVTGSERKAGREEVRTTAKTARKIIKSAKKAKTPEERQAAAKRYKTEILDKVKSPAWKKAYQDANTMGKGEMVAHVYLAGPFALLTIPAVKKQYATRQTIGPETEIGAAKAILEQIKNG